MKESSTTEGKRTRQLGLRFFSNASFYAVATALVRLGTLIVLPVYWRVLTPEDFGLIALSQIIIQLLGSILDLGLSGSIQRHYFEWKAEERPRHLAAVWTFSLSFSLIVCLLLSIAAPAIRNLFGAETSLDLVYFGIWIAFLQNFGLLPFTLCRIREQLPLFALLSIGQFIIQAASILIFIFAFHLGYQGFLWGTFVGSFFFAIFSLRFVLKEVQFPWTWGHLREPLSYALPTAPATIFEGAGSILDRFFLQRFIPLDQLGIYSLGRQFGQAYNFFVATLKISWVPLVFRMVAERKDAMKVLSRMSTYYLIVLLIPALAMISLLPDLIRWVGNPKYFGISPYIPYFVLTYVIAGFGHIYGRGVDLAKKTQYYWVIYGSHFGTNLILLWLWAPLYGTWGAVAALLTAGLVRESLLIGMSFYFYPMSADFRSIFKTVGVNIVGYLLLRQIPEMHPLASMLIKALCVAAVAALNFYVIFGKPGVKRLFDFIRRRSKLFEIPPN